jgi:hypothetical protein
VRRLLAPVLGAVLLVLAVGAPASAAGVGGVEVTPSHGSSFSVRAPRNGTSTEAFTLRNIGTTPATVRLYGADAREVDGAWSVGGAGSASWLALPDEAVTLAPGEKRAMTFSVRGGGAARTGAVVVEQSAGTVVQRAATLVHETTAPPVPLPLLLVAAAVALLLAAGTGVAAVARRRGVVPAPA